MMEWPMHLSEFFEGAFQAVQFYGRLHLSEDYNGVLT